MYIYGANQKSIKKVWKEIEKGKTVDMISNSHYGVDIMLYSDINIDSFISFEHFSLQIKFEAKCASRDFKSEREQFELKNTGRHKVWFRIE